MESNKEEGRKIIKEKRKIIKKEKKRKIIKEEWKKKIIKIKKKRRIIIKIRIKIKKQ